MTEAQREKERLRLRRWYAANREKVLARQATERRVYPERGAAARERARKWDEEHPEAARERTRRSARKHGDRYAARRRANREAERTRERRRYWADPEKARAKRRRLHDPVRNADEASARRARARKAFVERVYRRVVWERDEGVCGICGLAANPADWHLDHVLPLALGGEHSYANVQVSHPACNLRKGARMK